MNQWGNVPLGDTLPFFFDTFAAATGAPVTITGLATSDVIIYKGGSMTQRSSASGITLLDTDGIDVDGRTGIHGISIDTSDNTDAGFYVAGAYFTVVIDTITADGQTMRFVLGTFRLVAATSVAGVPKVDVTHFGGSAGTFSGGRPEVNTTHAAGTAWGSGAITAGSIGADAITAAKIANGAIDAATFGANALDAVWSTAARTLTANPGLDAAGIRTAVGLASANLDTQLSTINSVVDSILVDTAEIGAAGAGLTALATAANLATVASYLDTEIASIMAVTDKLDDTLEDDGGTYRFTVNALEQAPAGGGGGSTDWTADERTAIRAILGIPGSGTSPADPSTGILDTIRDAVATKASQASVDDLPTNAELATALGTADDAVLAAIADLPTNAELATALGTADDATLAAIATVLAAVGDLPTAVEISETLLETNLGAGADSESRSVRNALRFLRNKWSISGGTITVTKENDTTTAWTASVTGTPGADPVTAVDPA